MATRKTPQDHKPADAEKWEPFEYDINGQTFTIHRAVLNDWSRMDIITAAQNGDPAAAIELLKLLVGGQDEYDRLMDTLRTDDGSGYEYVPTTAVSETMQNILEALPKNS